MIIAPFLCAKLTVDIGLLKGGIVNNNLKLNYVEFASKNLPASKAFFTQAFNWQFQDFGPDYSAFNEQGVAGGFYQSTVCSLTENGAALLVLKADDLSAALNLVEQAGGVISKEIFAFPGGCRFHFIEPGGNELPIWSEN